MAKQFWVRIRDQIAAGNPPKVFVTRAGKLALDGSAAEMPEAVATLLPAEIREAAERVAESRRASEAAEAEKRAAERAAASAEQQAVIEEHGNRRVWRLTGLYVDDVSTARYTWAEIAAWLDWDAYNCRHNGAVVSAVCERGEDGDFAVDLAPYFACVDSPRTAPTFAKLAERLRDHVQPSRLNVAESICAEISK